ncbi:hypothetical protein GPX89_32775 [Nocardia sp. ET3-3]|uniref:Uncharacterized protein n=1 Tax=Nocardia terrae TaxID=2675851 RepID=A0A7K1V6A7_9NOCA|nr:hypothetical protein [Nocardia terrae]MVU82001.1 hypothetical protein [Nocardia terrae]
MNGWTQSRRALAVAALTATAALGATATATADQPKTPVEIGIDQLTQAVGDDAAGKTAVADIARADQLVAAAKLENVQFTSFWYQAPTLGCGFNMPFSLTNAMAVTGISGGTTSLPPGNVSFQAMAQQNGFPLASGLSVAWLNVNNGRSGITALDDQTEYNLPALSKTVDTGAGNVIASLWGTIDYPAARCVVTPTVGLFTVSDAPAVQPTIPATPDPNAPTTSGAPTTPAQAPDNSGQGSPATTTTAPAAPNPDAGSVTPAN